MTIASSKNNEGRDLNFLRSHSESVGARFSCSFLIFCFRFITFEINDYIDQDHTYLEMPYKLWFSDL